MRDYLAALEKNNEVKVVEGANWNLEIGAITELMAEKRGPALIFDRIEGYKQGFRVCSNLFYTTKRVALALDMPQDAKPLDIVRTWKDRLKNYEPVRPTEVKDGYVNENIMVKDRVNLLAFPTPKWHEEDGGRYIGSGAIIVTKDPETGWVNMGVYRVQVHDERTTGIFMNPSAHGNIMMKKYHAQGKNCPIAVMIGVDPALFLSSTFRMPYGSSEYDFAGWIKGSPVRVIASEHTGLPIAADAEIVLEGEIPPFEEENRPEGPFGEYTGYYGFRTHSEHVIRIKCIRHRNNPILQGHPPLKPPLSGNFGVDIKIASSIWSRLEQAGVPDVKGVYSLSSTSSFMVVVSIKQRYPGHATQAGQVTSACLGGPNLGRFIVVVDDDIDPANESEVLWAIATRCDTTENGINIVNGCISGPLDPVLSPEKKARGNFTTSHVIINACKPFLWFKDFPHVNKISDQLRQSVWAKWERKLLS